MIIAYCYLLGKRGYHHIGSFMKNTTPSNRRTTMNAIILEGITSHTVCPRVFICMHYVCTSYYIVILVFLRVATLFYTVLADLYCSSMEVYRD